MASKGICVDRLLAIKHKFKDGMAVTGLCSLACLAATENGL